MLELKTYTKAEMAEILGTTDNQGIKRKLNGYGVEYITEGRGKNITFKITKIKDKFKLFCITELKFDANTDFDRLMHFMYLFWNYEDYRGTPYNVLVKVLSDKNKYVSRQTISYWIDKLEKSGYIWTSIFDFRYYCTINGKIKEIPHELYKRGWRAYWNSFEKTNDKTTAYYAMRGEAGGYLFKKPIAEINAFYLNKIDMLIDIINERLSSYGII